MLNKISVAQQTLRPIRQYEKVTFFRYVSTYVYQVHHIPYGFSPENFCSEIYEYHIQFYVST